MSNIDDPHRLGDLILGIEQTLFLEVLGWDFYEDLKASMVDYSAQTTNWQDGNNYAVNDIVIYKNFRYRCIQANTAPINPTNALYWVEVDKFLEAEYNTIWKPYLLPAIAFRVMQSANVFRTYQSGPNGIQVTNSDYSQTAGVGELGIIAQQNKREGEQRVLLLDRHIMQDSKKDLAVFANYKPIKEGKGNIVEHKRRKRRFDGFNLGTREDNEQSNRGQTRNFGRGRIF